MKVCFVTGYSMSGAERQTMLIARGLRERGFEVSLLSITANPTARDSGWDGIPNYVLRAGESQPPSGFLHNRVQLARLLSEIDADVYVQRAMGSISGTIGPFCKLANRRFVYHSANSLEVSVRLAYMLTRSIGGSLTYHFGLMCADVILAQTESIAKAFRRALGHQKRVVVVPQIYLGDYPEAGLPREGYVLWVSRLVWYKQPLIFIEAARRLKNVQFVMVGSGPLEPLVKEKASSLSNLRYLGPQKHEEVETLCSKASVFANTSTFEGFPNTFLECASRSTPIVTLYYDPDEVICKFQMGKHSKTLEQFVQDIRGLTRDEETRRQMGANAREYVKRYHSPERLIRIYERLLDNF